jgi:hypothetical protein
VRENRPPNRPNFKKNEGKSKKKAVKKPNQKDEKRLHLLSLNYRPPGLSFIGQSPLSLLSRLVVVVVLLLLCCCCVVVDISCCWLACGLCTSVVFVFQDIDTVLFTVHCSL